MKYTILLVFLTGCSWYKTMPQDTWPEELLEEVIEYQTGVDVDLTIFSPEE